MSVDLMARRYAQAYCELARDNNEIDLDEAVQTLSELQGLFEPAMQSIFRNPEVSKDQRVQVVERVLSGEDLPLIRNFCLLLVRKNRFQYLDSIVQASREVADRLMGRKQAEVVSATKLDGTRRDQLRQRLGDFFEADIILDEEQDPELIAGLQVKVDDYLMDNSIAHQLERLRGRFRGNAN